MSFKLSKAERERRSDIAERLREAAINISSAVAEHNAVLATAREHIEATVDAYNVVLSEALEFAQDIASAAEEAISEKSESWQNGERGHAAEAWRSEWESMDLSDIEVDVPDDIDFDEPAHADELENAADDVREHA